MVQDPLSFSLINAIFPAEELSLHAAILMFVVIFKIIMHIITEPSKEQAAEQGEKKGGFGFVDNVMIYIAVIFFLPIWTLIPILMFQILKLNGLLPSIIKGPMDSLSARLPIEEHDPRSFSFFIFGSIITMIVLKIPFIHDTINAYSGFSRNLGPAAWGANIILLLFMFLVFSGRKTTLMANLSQFFISFIALSLIAGFQWVVFFLVLVALRPYIGFLKKRSPEEEAARETRLAYAGIPGATVAAPSGRGLFDKALDLGQMGLTLGAMRESFRGAAPTAAPAAPTAEKVPKAKILEEEKVVTGFGKPAPAEKLPSPEIIEKTAQEGAKAEAAAAGASSNKAAAILMTAQLAQNMLANRRAQKSADVQKAQLRKTSSTQEAVLKNEIKQLKTETCSGVYLFIALIIAVLKDALDLFAGLGAIPFADDLLVAIVFFFLLKKSKSGAGTWANLLIFLGEGTFGFLPLATVLVLWAIFYEYVLNKDRWELRSSRAQLYGRQLFKYAAAAIVIFMIIFGVAAFDLPVGQAMAYAHEKGYTDIPYQVEKAKEVVRNYNPVEIVEEWWERNLAIARGDYFIGEVEGSQNKKLGIFVKSKPLGDKKFYRGLPARVSATISGESLNTKECREKLTPDCYIYFDCNVEDFGDAQAYPRFMTILDIAGGGTRLDCDFTPLSPGPKKVSLKAYFDFSTKAYLPVVLVPYQSKLERDREELLAEAGYSAADLFVTKYTPGPVEIGIGFEEKQPLGVGRLEVAAPSTMPTGGAAVDLAAAETGTPTTEMSETKIIEPGFGITSDMGTPFGFNIRNLWKQGKILSIQNISIILPDNMELFKCQPEFTTKPKILKETNEVEYNLLKPIVTEGIEKFMTFDCWVKEREGSERPLLDGPTTTYFVKLTATYRYQVEDTEIARVEEFTKGGKVVADLTQLSAYDYCSEEVKENECEYPSKNYCDIDPCLQKCYWEPADRGSTAGSIIGGTLGGLGSIPTAIFSGPIGPTVGAGVGAAAGGAAQYLLFGGASCEKCPDDVECKDYEQNENACNLDPCELGCEWHKDGYCYKATEADYAAKFLFPVKSHRVSKCLADKSVQISTENQEVVAIEGGKLELKDVKIVIKHAYGYESTYKGLKAVRRLGNIAKNGLIGFAKADFEFSLKKNGQPVDLFELYKNQVPEINLRSVDPSCTGKNETSTK